MTMNAHSIKGELRKGNPKMLYVHTWLMNTFYNKNKKAKSYIDMLAGIIILKSK